MSARATSALKSFDPYFNWFGIKIDERPLNPYQLLGIQELERDKTRISAAADRRRNELQLHRGTEDVALWEQLKDELDAAIETLQNADEKAILDAFIRRSRKTSSAFADFFGDESSTLKCGNCQTENPGSRRFCSHCGNPLWTICSECQQISRATEKFCGGCGANHNQVRAQAIEAAEAMIEKALQLKDENRWQEALRVLQQLATVDDPRLEQVVQRAIELRSTWRHELQQHHETVEALERRALALWETGHNEAAIQLLGSVPSQSLSPTGRELLSSNHNRVAEIEALEREIKEAVERKHFNGIGALIDRLLMLRPDHPQATKLAHRLAAALKQSALKRHADGEYEKALDLLEQTPHIARGDEFHEFADRLSELAWLAKAVRQAPYANSTILGMAERLMKMVPRDAQVAELHNQLGRSSAADNRGIPRAWAKPPRRTTLGIPISVWTGPNRLTVDADCRDGWTAHADLMATALGLALQGLDRAEVQTNIRPEKRQLITNLPRGRRKPPTASWGIDIGQAGIKAVKMILDESSKPLVKEVVFVPHEHRISRQATDQQTAMELKTSLVRFNEQAKIGKERTCVGLSATSTLIKTVKLPPATGKQLRDLLNYEARQLFPLGLENLYWDSHVFASQKAEHTNDGFEPTAAVYVAAKRELVNAKLEVCQEYLNIDVLQSSALALHNLFAYECDLTPESAIGVLDFGAANSNFVVIAPSIAWYRSVPLCGDSILDIIVRQFSLTHAQAELVKREPLRAKRIDSLFRSIVPMFHDLIADLRRTIEMFQREHRNTRIEQLYLVGGAARMHGLLQHLWFGS